MNLGLWFDTTFYRFSHYLRDWWQAILLEWTILRPGGR